LLETDVLTKAGLTELPLCGGYVGMTVRGGFGHRPFGVEVRDVVPGTAAQAMGLQSKDVIVSVDREQLEDHESLSRAMERHRNGDTVKITFVRGEQLLMTSATLVPVPDGSPHALGLRQGDDIRRPVEYRWGVVVDAVDPSGPAEKAGIRPGDRLNEFEGKEIARPDDLRLALGDHQSNETAVLTISRRNQGRRRVAVVLDERAGRTGL
jgi:S1-C subfamily serine protease